MDYTVFHQQDASGDGLEYFRISLIRECSDFKIFSNFLSIFYH